MNRSKKKIDMAQIRLDNHREYTEPVENLDRKSEEVESNFTKVRNAIEYLDRSTNGQFSKEVIESLMNPSKAEFVDTKKVTTYPNQFHEVNNPKHYNSDLSDIECIQVVRHKNFNIGSAMKYLWRQGLKDNEPNIKDLKKAVWYIIDEIQMLGGNTSDIDLSRHRGINENTSGNSK